MRLIVSLPVLSIERSTNSRVLVSVKDLRRVDIPKLRRTTEELVVALQGAAAKIGLKKPTLEQAQQ